MARELGFFTKDTASKILKAYSKGHKNMNGLKEKTMPLLEEGYHRQYAFVEISGISKDSLTQEQKDSLTFWQYPADILIWNDQNNVFEKLFPSYQDDLFPSSIVVEDFCKEYYFPLSKEPYLAWRDVKKDDNSDIEKGWFVFVEPRFYRYKVTSQPDNAKAEYNLTRALFFDDSGIDPNSHDYSLDVTAIDKGIEINGNTDVEIDTFVNAVSTITKEGAVRLEFSSSSGSNLKLAVIVSSTSIADYTGDIYDNPIDQNVVESGVTIKLTLHSQGTMPNGAKLYVTKSGDDYVGIYGVAFSG